MMIRFVLFALFMSGACSAFAVKITNMTIEGGRRIEEETIRNYLGIKIGDEFTSALQDTAIKNLYETALFEDIDISFSGGRLKVIVKEMPLVSNIKIIGNSKVKSALLSRELLSKSGSSLSNAAVQLDVNKIKEIYKRLGRYNVQVDVKIEKLENNRSEVIFNVKEGPKTTVKNIYFVGNDNYIDSELKSVILTKESRWFRFGAHDTYDPDACGYDKELLRRFYNSVGYADFKVLSVTAELSPNKDHFNITYSINEGAKYSISGTSIESKIEALDTKPLYKFLTIKAGQNYNLSMLEEVADKIGQAISDMGYSQVFVFPSVKKIDQQTLKVVFVIEKSYKVFINNIRISGNLKTRDNVIRREFKIFENDQFVKSKIEAAERNLYNLDFFEKISFAVVPTDDPNRVNIDVAVQEKSTASIGFDVGYNTSEGMFGRLSFLDRNINGTGYVADIGVQRSSKKVSYSGGITNPHVMDRNVSLGVSVFNISTGQAAGIAGIGIDNQPYTLNSLGSRVTMGYDVYRDIYHSVFYTIKQDKLAAYGASSLFVLEQIGTLVTSAIGHTLVLDGTDNKIIPKNGYIISGTQEYAGLPGGKNTYLKHEVSLKVFKSFVDRCTLQLSVDAGNIIGVGGSKVRIMDRFNLGDFSLRGFTASGVGPADAKTGEKLGGQTFYTAKAELTFPLGLPKEFNVSGATFVDAGWLYGFDVINQNLYKNTVIHNSKDPRISVGVGIIWINRFAPVKVYWAMPVSSKTKHPFDSRQHFHLTSAFRL